MATSGTVSATTFKVNQIIDLAYHRCKIGPYLITGEMLEHAKDSLYIILSDLANTSQPSWCSTNSVLPMVAGQAYVTCTQGTINVRHVLYKDGTRETSLGRLSLDQYALLPDKTFTGRPTSYYVKRETSGVKLYLWPVPDTTAATKSLSVWYTRHVMDCPTYSEDLDIPQRWLEAVISELAYRLSIISEEAKPDMIALLKGQAKESLLNAWTGDNDGAKISIAPNIGCYNA